MLDKIIVIILLIWFIFSIVSCFITAFIYKDFMNSALISLGLSFALLTDKVKE